MNKKHLILSVAILFAMAGMNSAFADNVKSENTNTTPSIESKAPDSYKERPHHVRFQGPPPSDAPNFKKAPDGHGQKQFQGHRPSKEEMEQKRAEIEKRLKLTDEQKEKIKLQKEQDHEKIKPIMDQIIEKKKDFKNILDDKSLSQEAKDQKLKELKTSLKELKEQADSIRKENFNNFENLLTEKQKKEFEKIKSEQKKDMENRKKQYQKQANKKHQKKN